MVSIPLANRLGFIVLGLTNNFAYVIMLSAAYDLLKDPPAASTNENQMSNSTSTTVTQQPYCNEHSTSTILLADTLPSLTSKILYPFLLVGISTSHKALATALFSALSFIITGLTTDKVLIFIGVASASLSSGLGESTYLSNSPLYGDSALSGWSIGTGAAGLLGSVAYAVLRIIFSIKVIMLIMLVVPIAMLLAYFCAITPVTKGETRRISENVAADLHAISTSRSHISPDQQQQQQQINQTSDGRGDSTGGQLIDDDGLFDLRAKLNFLPSLAKYFMPLLLVYFAEYFINQGLFELVYYPSVTFLDHAAQYRWFQVSYQIGVMISRSTLDIFQIRNLWTMSLLQSVNAVLFLCHAAKLIHIPSFYIVIAIIIYEGLLGGFTYVNAFYRIKKEVCPDRQEFCISTVTIADSLGIVMAAMAAMPVHNALCKLYE